MPYYDIHTHHPQCLTGVEEEVKSILNTYPADFERLEKKDESLFSCGIHPWYLENFEQDYELLQTIVKDSRVVAIGEIGLDKLRGADMENQIKAFKLQIELATELKKPIIIHCVKAWEELIRLYKYYQPSKPWIIHGFSGNAEQAKQMSNVGFHFSIGEQYNVDAIREIPLQKLFCETDVSKMPIQSIYQQVGEILNIKSDDLANKITDNVHRYFFIN